MELLGYFIHSQSSSISATVVSAVYAWTCVPAEMWKQSFQVCKGWSPQPQSTNSLPTSRLDWSVWWVPRRMRIAVTPTVWVSHITLQSHADSLPLSFSFRSLSPSLNQPLSLLWSNKKEKATVSLKPHSARQTVELVWKSLSHWVYFSSEWPGLLALGEFRAVFGRRQTIISPLIHFNQQ